MTVVEMIQKVAIRLSIENGCFHASDVQKLIGDGTKNAHISYVRSAIGKLVNAGKLKVVGEGANRMYASINYDYVSAPKKTKTSSGQPRSNMRILDLNDIVPMAENE